MRKKRWKDDDQSFKLATPPTIIDIVLLTIAIIINIMINDFLLILLINDQMKSVLNGIGDKSKQQKQNQQLCATHAIRQHFRQH